MKIHERKRHTAISHWQLFILLSLLLFCAACSTGSATSVQNATPTVATMHQPVSGQQILAGPVTYVALGASDAVGVGSTEPGAQGYVPLLTARLPKGSHQVNLGISGIHLHEALTQELPLALSTNPQLITIWLVANDFVANVSYDSYMHDLNTLLQQLRSGTHARIVMANLPDLSLLPAFSRLTSTQKATMQTAIKHWNAGIASTAAQYNVTIVDLFSQRSALTSHPEYISDDGFHPSPQGYVQLANFFWQAIKA